MSLTYPVEWFAKAILSHDGVAATEVLDQKSVKIDRKDLPPITVVPAATDRLDLKAIQSVLSSDPPTVVVLVPRLGHYCWEARVYADDHGSTIQTYGELCSFMYRRDPRGCLDKNVAYARDRVKHHSKVGSVTMICEALMRVRRVSGMCDLLVAVEYKYEFTEEALVEALNRHPDADIIFNTNPNGRTSLAAASYANAANVKLLDASELFRALNYD